MKAENIPTASLAADTRSCADIVFRELSISLRSRIILWLMRHIARPLLARIVRSGPERIAKFQLRVASMRCPDSAGLPLDYSILGSAPGHVVGSVQDTTRPVLLWLHGGAFILPAAPAMHLVMVARLCRDLGASAFVPDYRLAPANPFPSALDDCEQAYRTLLDKGHSPSNIVLCGDSAGGNLALGVLQRIRKASLPMPCCAVAVSPVTEMGRIHAPPSRYRASKADPLLPIAAMQHLDALYTKGWNTADPELSPLYMDCSELPPLFFVASSGEILMDDTVMLARRAGEAGVPTTCHIWPLLPHAFPLFSSYFPEARTAQADIADFMRQHLKS